MEGTEVLREEAEDEEVLQQAQARGGGRVEQLQLRAARGELEAETAADAVLQAQARR